MAQYLDISKPIEIRNLEQMPTIIELKSKVDSVINIAESSQIGVSDGVTPFISIPLYDADKFQKIEIVKAGDYRGLLPTGATLAGGITLDDFIITESDIKDKNVYVYHGQDGWGISEKSKFIYVDEARTALHAKKADEATNALSANFSLDSKKWDGHYFPDYLDQPVRKEDSPVFKGLSSEDFASGFAGHGYRISKDVNGYYIIEIDRAVIRKDFTVYELIASQVRAVNGSLAVTDGIKIKSVVQDGESYICTIDTADGTMYTPFRVDDNVLCQVFNGNVKYYRGLVTATTSDTFTIEIYEGTSIPEVGDTVVRWGNNTDNSRQGMIYMTTTDVDSPFQDVRDGITQSNPNGNLKVRLGKLDGVTSPTWGALNGYGLFGQNVYLENGNFSGRLTIKGTGSNVYTKDETDEQIDTVAATWELIPISDKQVHAFNYDATGTLNTLVYSVKFMRGGKDVTAIMQQSGLNLYNFERKNTYGFDDNGVSDASWNAAHVGAKTVTLTDKDIYAVGTLEVVYDETILETEYKRLTNGN